MPKKFRGENSKAVEARQRKAAVADAAKAEKIRAEEDARWADDDKSFKKKQERKADRDAKKAEAMNRKKEKEVLYKAEMDALPSKKSSEVKKIEKVTRAEIMAQKEKEEKAKRNQLMKATNVKENGEGIEENINRAVGDLVASGSIIEARSVEDAITALGISEDLDRHPERRMKAAYSKFEEENLPRLKKENPNLRQSQLKQMLRKDWQKCPDNPMNQRFLSYNAKKN